MEDDAPRTTRRERQALTEHEQMRDAERQCAPCLLCGGSAVISDAGAGAGYYVACSNSRTFRDSKGCLIGQRRLGGWAYNVMEWWNRLHMGKAKPPIPTEDALRAALTDQVLSEVERSDDLGRSRDVVVRAILDTAGESR